MRNALRFFLLMTASGIWACTCQPPSNPVDGGATDSGSVQDSGGCAQPGAPIGLTVTSSDQTGVGLSWTASSTSGVTYSVRRTLWGTTAFAEVGTSTTTTYKDTTIDITASYQYQVLAVTPLKCYSPASNVVPTGAPPPGFTTVAPLTAARAALPNPVNFGVMVASAPDPLGAPFIGYFDVTPPLPDGGSVPTNLDIAAWNRVTFQYDNSLWASVGITPTNPSDQELAVASDTSNGAEGLLYTVESVNGPYIVSVGLRTASGSVNQKVHDDDGVSACAWPSLALAKGTAYATYFHESDSTLHYVTGPESGVSNATTAPPTGWTDTLPPLPANASFVGTAPASVAVDSTGAVAVAYWVVDNTTSYPYLLYWRPPATTTTTVFSTAGVDNVWGTLTFQGTAPRIVFLDDTNGRDTNWPIWVTTSTDGTTWSTPANVTPDTGTIYGLPINIAIGSQGQGAIAYWAQLGAGGNLCGEPKLAQSTNLTTWATCSPDGNNTLNVVGTYPTLFYSAKDKIYLTFSNPNPTPAATELAGGVILWHQP